MRQHATTDITVLIIEESLEEREQIVERLESYQDITALFSAEEEYSRSEVDTVLLPCRELAQRGPRVLAELEIPVLSYGPVDTIHIALAYDIHDFVHYPFLGEELPARIYRSVPFKFTYSGERFFQFTSRQIICGQLCAQLSYLEYRLLKALTAVSPEPLSRERLAEFLPDPGSRSGRSLDMTISKLRRKIQAVTAEDAEFIRAERSLGYRIIPPTGR